MAVGRDVKGAPKSVRGTSVDGIPSLFRGLKCWGEGGGGGLGESGPLRRRDSIKTVPLRVSLSGNLLIYPPVLQPNFDRRFTTPFYAAAPYARLKSAARLWLTLNFAPAARTFGEAVCAGVGAERCAVGAMRGPGGGAQAGGPMGGQGAGPCSVVSRPGDSSRVLMMAVNRGGVGEGAEEVGRQPRG